MTTPSTSPFAEVIQALAVLHREQHQAILDIRAKQEERFKVLMEAQRKDHGRSVWVAPGRLAGESHPAAVRRSPDRRTAATGRGSPELWHLKRAILQRAGRNPEEQRQRFRSLKLEESGWPFIFAQQLRDACRRWLVQDDRTIDQIVDAVVLEQFIARLPSRTSEWVQCHRPDDLETAIQLAEDHLVARSRVGEVTSLSLSPPVPPLSLSPPIPRPRSRGPPIPTPRRRIPGPEPQRRTHRWGTYRDRDGEARGMGGPTAMTGLSPAQSVGPAALGGITGRSGPACWHCGGADHAPENCSVMEVGALVRLPDVPAVAPGRDGLYRIPVSIKGGTYQALVDSGCNQTSIHQSLLQDPALDMSRTIRVRCVHGDVIHYPLTAIDIQFRGKKHRVEVAVNPHLKHPLILGTNWPGFNRLLGVLCAGVSWKKKSPDRGRVAQLGESQAVTSRADSGEGLGISRCKDFPLEQSRDDTLKHALERVQVIDGKILQPDRPLSYPYFAVINDRVYRVTQDAQTKEDTTQLLVPKSRREMLFQAAHSNPMAGHLGQAATLNRLMTRFFWPGIHGDISRWCAACSECQLVNPPATPKVPLRPLPIMEIPFERIGMDLIGPLERSARGHRFALVLVDYATRYPEAVVLRNISAKSVAEALFCIISRVGIPKEILTDQGTAFMSRTMRELYGLLGIKSIRTSVYHPQTDGLVERFNRTLKSMIRKFVHEDAKNWDKWLEPLLFAVREVPQASTGFSPFELLYGRQPRGVLDVVREAWEDEPSNSKNEIEYILDLRAKLHTLGRLSTENLLKAQDDQRRRYDKGTKLRKFSQGDKVLVLLPTSSSKLLAKWQGPFVVTRRVSDLNYSDWASPIVLVPKTDGSVRFCVDYRKVNAVSKFDAYPMPRIDELLDRLGAARYYSTLDLTKGYWQMPLSPISREKQPSLRRLDCTNL
ncbi:uncharacterized protein [Danio rerio]|uniref:Uncharacterized protein n=1 Tax=Danio rerio TaxID=7955 RepID=A0AC58G5I3_DANRE